MAGEPLELRATTPAGLDRGNAGAPGGRDDDVAARDAVRAVRRGARGRECRRRQPSRRCCRGHGSPRAPGVADRGRRLIRRVARLRYRFTASDGTAHGWHAVIVAGWSSVGGELVGLGRRWADRLIPDSVEWLVAGGSALRVRFALRLDPTRTSSASASDSTASISAAGARTRSSSSSTRARASARICRCRLRSSHRQRRAAGVPRPDKPANVVRRWGDHRRTCVVEAAVGPAASTPSLEVSLYDGDPSTVLAAFLEEVGPPVQPPDWVFRLWMSGNEWNTQARIVAEVERTIAEDIPSGVVVVEAWSDEATSWPSRCRVRRPSRRRPAPPGRLPVSPGRCLARSQGPGGLAARTGPRFLLWQEPTAQGGYGVASTGHG